MKAPPDDSTTEVPWRGGARARVAHGPYQWILDNVPEASVPDFTEMVAEHSLALSAHQALHRLPEPYREVFTLKTFCELSSKEIAALFGKSESWARVTAYRAKQMLLDAMKGDETHEERL